ncbi:MAG: hypothetical protein ACT4PE_13455 [Candidatus Eiseniibacteriota bacterium]
MRRFAWAFPAFALAGGCAGPPEDDAPAGPVLPFIADDYQAALAEARSRQLPLFIDSWAPW